MRAVDGVSLTIGAGETVCLVGESGCGKTVTALSIARLVPTPPANYVGGEILLNGRDVLKMSNGELRDIRGGVVSYVFQEPGAALNPVFRIGNQIKESLKLHKPEKATNEEVIRLLKLVGIPAPESRIKNYPFEMSGGMQQRVMIAMALASEPKLLVADEPTTALDVTIQAQILELLHELKQRLGMAILLITHNLGIVGDMADRVAVMYAGQIVELSPAKEFLRRPLHPYTRALMNAVPKLARRRRPPFGHSRQRAAHRQFPARLPFRPALPDCQTGMFRKNSRTGRGRTRTLGAMSVLENTMSLLEVKNLKVHFPVKHGMFSRVREFVKAVDDVSFSIEPGETLGLGRRKRLWQDDARSRHRPAGRADGGQCFAQWRGHHADERLGVARSAAEVPDDFPGPLWLAQPAHDG